MDKKFGLILIFVFVLVIIVSLVYFVSSVNNQDQSIDQQDVGNTSTQNTNNNTVTSNDPITNENQVVVVKPKETKKDIPVGQFDIERMSKSFAERFGSFSNQSNYANIIDLKMFMSRKMQKWANDYVEENKKNNVANEVYFGITTKALSAEVIDFDDAQGEAEVMVQTRRREAVGTTNNSSKLYNQNIQISFVKENGVWKVDSAYWQ